MGFHRNLRPWFVDGVHIVIQAIGVSVNILQIPMGWPLYGAYLAQVFRHGVLTKRYICGFVVRKLSQILEQVGELVVGH